MNERPGLSRAFQLSFLKMQELPHSDACERNKFPIRDVLEGLLPKSGRVLEIGSCTGQHIVCFSDAFPGLKWQPSDTRQYLPGLQARISREGPEAVLTPIELDVLLEWPEQMYQVIYSANTAHIMGWPAVQAMFSGVGRVLLPGGRFLLYGPFRDEQGWMAPSNEQFDRSLRARDPAMGIRDISSLEKLADRAHLKLMEKHALPANNQLLVFERQKGIGDD